MSALNQQRVLIIGAGSIGERHTRCFLKLPGIQASICEPNDAVRAAAAEKYPLDDAFADFGAVPLDQFHAVVICTPAPLHIPMAIRALEASCHVLCEKPLSTSLDGVDDLKAAIEKSGRVFRVGYTWRQHPGANWIKARLGETPVTPILSAVVHTGQDFAFFRPAYRDIYYARHETGGGAIQDAATHMIDQLQWYLGPARSVTCTADHLALEGVDVEDTVHLTMRFQNNPAIATLVLNQFQKNNDCRIELAAVDRTLRIDLADATTAVYQDDRWTSSPIPARARDDNYVDQARAFLDAVTGKPSNLATLDEAVAVLRTTLAALESARTGQSVRIAQ